MNTTVRLAAHLLTFGGLLVLLRPATVEPTAWLVVFTIGWVFLILAPSHRAYPKTQGTWIKAALYTLLLAILFFGTDLALQVLGNTVRPRAPLPPHLGGLELYWFLVPGVLSIATGALAGAVLERRTQPQAKGTLSSPTVTSASEA